MQRDIMKYTANLMLLHPIDKSSSFTKIFQFQKKHMRIVSTVLWNERYLNLSGSGKWEKCFLIGIPCFHQFPSDVTVDAVIVTALRDFLLIQEQILRQAVLPVWAMDDFVYEVIKTLPDDF